MNAERLCYHCVIEASRNGKFVIYGSETSEKCKNHPAYNLWEVDVSPRRGELIRQLTSMYEYAKNKKPPLTDLPKGYFKGHTGY